MTKPMLLAEFTRLPPTTRAVALDGLSGAIDLVAQAAPETHRFLRYQWFAAALAAYGGSARTILIERDGDPVIALPMIPFGPGPAHLAAVPGCPWPFRGFPVSLAVEGDAFRVLVDSLGQEVNALRIGPVQDGDAALELLLAAARAQGWATLDRFVAGSFLLDMPAAETDDRRAGTTVHEEQSRKGYGTCDTRSLSGPNWRTGGIDVLASIEEKGGIAAEDARFRGDGHGAFWRGVAVDPVLADMMAATLLTVDGTPAAFSFGVNTGALHYAIAEVHDSAFSMCSPGRLLRRHGYERALAHGVGRICYGAGVVGRDALLGARQGPAIRDWMLVRPGLPALLGRALRSVWERSGRRPAGPAIDGASSALA